MWSNWNQDDFSQSSAWKRLTFWILQNFPKTNTILFKYHTAYLIRIFHEQILPGRLPHTVIDDASQNTPSVIQIQCDICRKLCRLILLRTKYHVISAIANIYAWNIPEMCEYTNACMNTKLYLFCVYNHTPICTSTYLKICTDWHCILNSEKEGLHKYLVAVSLCKFVLLKSK